MSWKRIIVAGLISLIIYFATMGLAMVSASDITHAQWRTTVVVTNNSTTATNVSTNFTLSTPDMITAGILNSTASDAALIGTGGADIPFMPGSNSTNPWWMFLPSVSGGSSTNYYLYSHNVTGGKYAFFPATTGTGMSIGDAASLEFGSNFNFSIHAFFDMTRTSTYLFFKDTAIGLYIPVTPGTLQILAGGVLQFTISMSSGEHTLRLYSDSGNITASVDGVVAGTHNPGGAVPDNSTAIAIGVDGNIVYMTSCNITTGGTLHGSWKWNYGATFPDDSGNGNTMTPYFRTAATSAFISAVVSEQTALVTSTSPSTGSSSTGWNMITGIPTAPAGLYTEGGTAFPGGPQVASAETAAHVPAGTFMFILAFGTAALLGGGAFKLTHVEGKGVKGSLLIMLLVMEGVLFFWTRIGGGVIPAWTLIPLGIGGILLLLFRNPFSATS